MTDSNKELLYEINSPQDLKLLSPDELEEYGRQLRDFIVSELSENPGHLGSSLGALELGIALQYVYDTPGDKIVWDVGHQAYAHKIITGRRDRFSTNRKLGGISGFPSMWESEYDSFGVGHSSTSISAALGIAIGQRLNNDPHKVVAVIGDGALTGGLAYEGLNNAGVENTDLLVILNDNRMSIDKNVGAMKEYLLQMTTSGKYNNFKNKVWKSLSDYPRIRRSFQKFGNVLKHGILQQSNLFESLNFRYFGPVDGNDLRYLIKVLKDLQSIPGPKLLHILTTKGNGYIPALEDPTKWHAPGKFDPETGESISSYNDKEEPPKYQEVFGHTIVELAENNPKIVGITPAMPTGCSLDIMMEKMPDRTFDVGIAEGHAVTFSAGLATQGIIPFCNIYSSFIQRAYDNVIHDVALQKLDVVFCLDRSGIVGEDGATHQGVFDIAFFRAIPDIIISSPMNEEELRNLMYTAQQGGYGAFVIRYPKARAINKNWRTPFSSLPIGKGRLLKDGSDIALLSLGHTGNFASLVIEAAEMEGISVAHIDLRFAKPLDEELLHYAGSKFSHIITVEDGVINGGIGSAVLEFLNGNGYKSKVHMLGVPDKFIPHGKISELHHICGYDTEGILNKIKEIYEKNK
ncbi:MAG: 1-deoxy-D-xylulose-5-phosphate synthase [Rikenellaceae bacterium]|nr:1-deoxy-D-xylulose-5-phosphate synthase [Rikenellaceae bacterium]